MATINLAIGPVVALIAGILILLVPRLLNYIVAIYLIVIGLIGIFGWGGARMHTTAIDSGNRPVLIAVAGSTTPAVVDVRTRLSSNGSERPSASDSQGPYRLSSRPA